MTDYGAVEVSTLVPGGLAWGSLLAAAAVTLTVRSTALPRISAVACMVVGLLAFSIPAASSAIGRRRSYDRPEVQAAERRAEVRAKLSFGVTSGMLPVLGGAALLALSLRRRR